MIDREKVIKGFECCHVMVHDLGPDKTSCGICPYKNVQTEEQINLGGIECIAVLHDDALALLKEQEAVPAMQREIMHMLFWCCGSCGVAITDGDKFCRMCGKAVKWNDKD